MENPEQSNELLAHRLRNAAIDRTAGEAERVEHFVLDPDGVIDLRDLDNDPSGSSVADPAKALATIRGQLGDAYEVSHLYAEVEEPKPRWRLGLRARHAYGNKVPSAMPDDLATATLPTGSALPKVSRLSMVPLDEEKVARYAPEAERTPEPEPTVLADTATDESIGTDESIDLTRPDDHLAAAPADTGVFAAGSMAESVEPEVDTDEQRPTADCPKCMGLGHRDLFDRFSQVEFYSCDNCMHMWQQDLS